ncbi:hypothetical protein St703_11120 [Sporolactobacillus terrae]|uniref:Uncharacterized protein n=1 Tax=Sporolactobacillus terrae TaxID=269673 RepID=A0A5K7WVM1_9BACL|nr:hypothetical protein St703_11120 [Sporolactobacillus terrae]
MCYQELPQIGAEERNNKPKSTTKTKLMRAFARWLQDEKITETYAQMDSEPRIVKEINIRLCSETFTENSRQ